MGLRASLNRRRNELTMRSPRPRLCLGCAAALVSLALVAGACGSNAAPTTTTTTTLPPLPPQVYAYVTMIGSGTNIGTGDTVTPVNVSLGSTGTGSPVTVGTWPDAVAITPDGERAYVTNYTSNSVTPINLTTGRALAAIALGPNAGPAGIAISPDGKTAYVTDAGAPGTIGDTVVPIDLATDKPMAPVTVGYGPQGIAVTPNGQRAYVADAGAVVKGQTGSYGSTVTPIDLETMKALAPIKVGNVPIAVTITPDGSTALVANLNSGSVSPIDIANDTAGAPISLVGGPIAIAVASSDPTVAWVADSTSGASATGNVTPIDLSNDTAGAPIAVGKNPQDIAAAPDGSAVWVVCYQSQSLVPISTATQKVGTAIALPGGPDAIAMTSRSASETTTTLPGTGASKKKT